MSDKEKKVNFGFIFSGAIGLYWAYKEFMFKGDADSIFYLKNLLKHPVSLTGENEGKLVYVTGNLRSSDASLIQDDLFRVSVPGLKLRRKVEMFQFYKESDAYKNKWSDKPISSSGFLQGFENPKWKIHNFEATHKGDLMVGEYKLADFALKNIESWREVIGKYKGDDFKQTEQGGKLVLNKSKKKYLRPKVGNYRISHEYIPNGLFVSVIGQQKSGKIAPYKGLFIMKEGLIGADKLVDEYGKQERFSIWKTRAACSLGVGLGLYLGFH